MGRNTETNMVLDKPASDKPSRGRVEKQKQKPEKKKKKREDNRNDKLPLNMARLMMTKDGLVEINTNDERLEQAIILLSDEGPENCMDFEKKLAYIKGNLLDVFPEKKKAALKAAKGASKTGEASMPFEYDEKKFRRVFAMAAAHQTQIEFKKGPWFENREFPNYYGNPFLDNPKNKKKPSKPGVMPSLPGDKQYTSFAASMREPGPAEKLLEFSRDPWHEQLPSAEVWHRDMAPFFPFGDTPHMESVLSREIENGLIKGKCRRRVLASPMLTFAPSDKNQKPAPPGWIKNSLNSVVELFTGKPKDWNKAPWVSPWNLPEVTDEEVEKAVKEWEAMQRKRVTSGTSARALPKLTGYSTHSKESPVRRPRPTGNESGDYMMSDALQ